MEWEGNRRKTCSWMQLKSPLKRRQRGQQVSVLPAAFMCALIDFTNKEPLLCFSKLLHSWKYHPGDHQRHHVPLRLWWHKPVQRLPQSPNRQRQLGCPHRQAGAGWVPQRHPEQAEGGTRQRDRHEKTNQPWRWIGQIQRKTFALSWVKTPRLPDSFQAYMAYSTIAESQVKVLGPASRMASTTDINMWNISEIDTLSALMDSSNGKWEQSLARAVIMKYLSVNGNKLGSAELNSLRGPNLCTLDISILSNISTQSIRWGCRAVLRGVEPFSFLLILLFIFYWYFSVSHRDADALEILNCTTEKKKVLFTIAEQAFTTKARSTTVSPSTYQLLKSYLRRQTHPINAHMNASFDHKVSVRLNLLFFFMAAWSRCSFVLHPDTVDIEHQHGHVHLHQPGWERCSG